MTTITSGLLIKQFYQDQEFWPDDDETFQEDVRIEVNGEEWDVSEGAQDIPDESVIAIISGCVIGPSVKGGLVEFEKHFQDWENKQGGAARKPWSDSEKVTFTVQCDIQNWENLARLISDAGGAIIAQD